MPSDLPLPPPPPQTHGGGKGPGKANKKGGNGHPNWKHKFGKYNLKFGQHSKGKNKFGQKGKGAQKGGKGQKQDADHGKDRDETTGEAKKSKKKKKKKKNKNKVEYTGPPTYTKGKLDPWFISERKQRQAERGEAAPAAPGALVDRILLQGRSASPHRRHVDDGDSIDSGEEDHR